MELTANLVKLENSRKLNFFKQDFSKLERRAFIVGLIVKLSFGAVLASEYLTGLFLPFLQAFIQNPSQNPYMVFQIMGEKNAFPYPAGMLWLLSSFVWPMTVVLPGLVYGEIFAVRLILLIADVLIFLTMRKWLAPRNRMRLLLIYWLNPIAFYISFAHGQLDAIPISLLIMSMSFLFSRRFTWSAIMFGLALTTKTSIGLALPVFLLYFMQMNKTSPRIFQFLFISSAIFALVNLPFIFTSAFAEMVLFNAEQAKVFDLSLQLGELRIFWVLVALIALSVFGFKIGITNPNLFIIFTGFFFSCILILIPPMHGWYYWILPFFAYFYSRESDSSNILFNILIVFYFLYFLISPKSDYFQIFQLLSPTLVEFGQFYHFLERLGLDVALLQNITFTTLQSTLTLICVQILSRGLLRYRLERITGKPFLLGIGGNSGVGKTNLAEKVKGVFGTEIITDLRGDDQHKWQRGSAEWNEFTHLNPKANHLYLEVETLKSLKNGKKVWRRSYNHNTGKFTDPMPVVPKRLMVFEGLHTLFLGDQRDLFDLKIFLEPDQELANHWKICRDKRKREYTKEQILLQIKNRELDLQKYISSQKQFSDIVISPRADRAIMPFGDETAEFELEYHITLKNSFNLDDALNVLIPIEGLNVEHWYKDTEFQCIIVSGCLETKQSYVLLNELSERLQEVDVPESSLPKGLLGAVIFLISSIILQEAKNV